MGSEVFLWVWLAHQKLLLLAGSLVTVSNVISCSSEGPGKDAVAWKSLERLTFDVD